VESEKVFYASRREKYFTLSAALKPECVDSNGDVCYNFSVIFKFSALISSFYIRRHANG
jgi:hypothetical protein